MKEMQEALKNLKQVDSIMILPADKGRANVADTYHEKIKTLPKQVHTDFFINTRRTGSAGNSLTHCLKRSGPSTTRSNLGTKSHQRFTVNLSYTTMDNSHIFSVIDSYLSLI